MQMAHNVCQLARGELATSTRAVTELRQADSFPVGFGIHAHLLTDLSCVRAQSRTSRPHNNGLMSDLSIDTFERLETAMWKSLVDGDGQAADRLLSSDYLGVYTTGFSDRADYIAALADGPVAAWFEISQSRIFALSETAVMYSYRADFRSQLDGPDEAMYISSLWCLRDGRWMNVFSQDTPSEDAKP